MTLSLHQKLLRAVGLPANTHDVPPRLADLAAQLQSGLGLAKQGPASVRSSDKPAANGPSAFTGNAGLLEKMQHLGLGRTGSSREATSAPMLSRTYRAAEGSRPYRLFVPPNLPPAPGLIVMLHGCTQAPEDFAAGTRMNDVAGAEGFLVLYPEQTQSANLQRCWNWFNPADQQRGQGEPALIAGMTRSVMSEFGVDPAQVFVAGLSAGGAKAAIMGTHYPDLFRAIGVHSGLACGAAHDMASGFAAMRHGKPGHGRLEIPTIIFHGDRDTTVNPANASAIADQINELGPPETIEGRSAGGLAYTRIVRRKGSRPLLEQWTIHGAGHAWSGGSSQGSFTEAKGPDASSEMLRFFRGSASTSS